MISLHGISSLEFNDEIIFESHVDGDNFSQLDWISLAKGLPIPFKFWTSSKFSEVKEFGFTPLKAGGVL